MLLEKKQKNILIYRHFSRKKRKIKIILKKRLTKKTKDDIVIVFQEGTAKKIKKEKRLIKNENRQTKKVYFNGRHRDLSIKLWWKM